MQGSSAAPQQSSAFDSNSQDFEGANQGGEVSDFQGLFDRTNQELEQTKKQSTQLQTKLSQVEGEARKSSEVVDRMRRALMGDEVDQGQMDPYDKEIADLEAEMDQYLHAAIEAEKRGSPIPLTTKNGIDNLKNRIDFLQYKREMEKERQDLREQVKRLSNPSNTIDQQAYSNIDSHIVASLETIFGPQDTQVKEAQFYAISKQIADEVSAIQKQDPQLWDRIRRDHKAQVRLVNNFVKQNIPPKARELLEQDRVRRTPLSTNELLSAWKEAKELAKTDPGMMRTVQELREQLVGRLWEKNAGKSSRVQMNDLYND